MYYVIIHVDFLSLLRLHKHALSGWDVMQIYCYMHAVHVLKMATRDEVDKCNDEWKQIEEELSYLFYLQ